LAELFSLAAFSDALQHSGFSFRFINTRVAKALFEQPDALVWSTWHVRAVAFLRRSGMYRAALGMVNDEPGFFNRRINPTWYLLCRKLPS
jgi:hypothetical protein